ncbi:MAG: ATP-binding protein [Phycisphaerales bacterium]
MWRGLSLANKCMLLFGAAILLIVTVALAAPWVRMNIIVAESQLELSRQLVSVWESGGFNPERLPGRDPIPATRLTLDEFRAAAEEDGFFASALEAFESDDPPPDAQASSWRGAARRYVYLRPVYRMDPPAPAGLDGVIVLDRLSVEAARLLALNAVYHIGAGLLVLALAVLVFYLIINRLILEPVRGLRVTAERVGQGELNARSTIRTGDEFEQLGDAFNTMLSHVQRSQDQLRSINSALDEKIGELASANVALYEAARIKGEFLANVSHELRTPLNSIIGFTELLLEIAQAEAAAGDDSTKQTKRVRYLQNILGSSRHLLELIDSLLEMARIEAGRSEIRIERVAVMPLCESLVGLMEPMARRKDIEFRLEVPPDLPEIESDPKKLQQILFNFLSNAVKFTATAPGSRSPTVVLRAERLHPEPGRRVERTRFCVIDTGPGIAPRDQQRIFEKFQQADAGLARGHEGTGLGLAISKELATLLQGEIQLVSDVGRGSMFSLIVPNEFDRTRLPIGSAPSAAEVTTK